MGSNSIHTGEDGTHDPSRAVLEAVGEAEDADPERLRPPLYEMIDPEALNELFTGRDGHGRVSFRYHGYHVTVYGDGDVMLERRDEPPR